MKAGSMNGVAWGDSRALTPPGSSGGSALRLSSFPHRALHPVESGGCA
jgi:hypothetical protein